MNSAERSGPMRVALISLGCAKNLVDSEIMLGTLLEQGFEVINDAAGADALIVNTCSFIDAAQQESVEAILEAAHERDARRPGQALIVAGCLPQRFGRALPALLPEVEAFMGLDQVTGVGEIVRGAVQLRRAKFADGATANRGTSRRGRPAARRSLKGKTSGSGLHEGFGRLDVTAPPKYLPDADTARLLLTAPHMAYVKIAEGCNHPCTFCTIPRIRGRYRSRPLEDILREAEALVAAGVKELNLISQDSTYYGRDLSRRASGIPSVSSSRECSNSLPVRAGVSLSRLLRGLDGLAGDFWIRVLYTHPAHWTEELIETMAACRKVVRYADIPLQHIHDNLLERMRRGTTRQYLEEQLQRIRAGIPGIVLRTTFIVGFPGETEACFRSLLDFVREMRFERLGVFCYSAEAGTRAAAMAGQVPAREKRRRRDLLLAAQREVSAALAAARVGQTLRVLVDRPANEEEVRSIGRRVARGRPEEANGGKPRPGPGGVRWYAARSEADAPDVDGRVFVQGLVPVGQFASVRVLGHTDYDLIARRVTLPQE